MKIILASASLGRKKILTDLGLKFTVLPTKIDERKIKASNPIALVKKIAKAKAETVYKKLFTQNNGAASLTNFRGTKAVCTAENFRQASRAPTIIIAADSMVYFQGKTYGKPKDKKEAKAMLAMLSGQTHEFITGVCIILASQDQVLQKPIIKSCKSQITFEKFTKKEINDYVKIADVTSFAGGFAPNLKGGEIIKKKMHIKDSVSNILGGLPLEILVPILKANGIKI